ncbi:MAG: phosphopentomutase [Actinomycetota bacterium]|nr:phosphopentomutase [Actinomycetota bacterium]
MALPVPPPASAERRRVALVVCDSLGIGHAPDAARYGDEGANTLAHVAAAVGGLSLPVLERWGIGRLTGIAGVPPVTEPEAVVARLTPTAAGKDSTTGHWELMGYRNDRPFPTYPDGFPLEIIESFSHAIGRGVLGNRAASGTVIIEDLGQEHLATGKPIIYTSADSVFQIAAHEQVVPLQQLYEWCGTARELLTGAHRVGRVIARPFTGQRGSFRRTLARRDFTVPPPETTGCEVLHNTGVAVKAVGKIEDLFARRGITFSVHTGDNEASLAAIGSFLREDGPALVFANLVDFDQSYGHRNDPSGYAKALERFDHALGSLSELLSDDDRILITGDHGNDPTRDESTDHTRELVPLLGWGRGLERGADLGIRSSLADVGTTVLDLFGLQHPLPADGLSFAEYL